MSLVFKGIYLGGSGGGSANLTTLDVTPMTNYQSISPEEGYDGFSLVNVSAVTSAIDPNITSANIVNGCNILGVIGTASASAPKEVARYVIDENGVLSVSSADLTGKFDDVTYIVDRGLQCAYTHTNVSGDINMSNCRRVGNYGMYQAFYNTNINSSFYMNNIYLYSYALYQAFVNSNIKTATLNNIYTPYSVNNTLSYAFSGSSIEELSMGFRYGNVDSAYVQFQNLCANCKYLDTVYCNNLISAQSSGFFNNSFADSGVKNIMLPNLSTVGSTSGGGAVFNKAFTNANRLSNFYVNRLQYIYRNGAFNNSFYNTTLSTLYFNSFTNWEASAYYNFYRCFQDMLRGVNGCTVHFPSNLEATLNSWTDVTSGFSGTNTTVLFDLSPVSDNFSDFYNMTESGTTGGQTIAVSASSNSENAYKAINSTETIGWQSSTSDVTRWFTLYCPEGMSLECMNFTTNVIHVNATTNIPIPVNLCASNDDTNWKEIPIRYQLFTPQGTVQINALDIANSYKYYRFYFNAKNDNPSYKTTINTITIIRGLKLL